HRSEAGATVETRWVRHAAGPAGQDGLSAAGDVLAAPRRQSRASGPMEMARIGKGNRALRSRERSWRVEGSLERTVGGAGESESAIRSVARRDGRFRAARAVSGL